MRYQPRRARSIAISAKSMRSFARPAARFALGATPFDNTGGLEAIDATHLVRTALRNPPIDCDASSAGCHQAGLEILEFVTAAGGGHELHVAHQLFLPDLPGRELNLAFPVGVAPVGTGFAVTTLPKAEAHVAHSLCSAELCPNRDAKVEAHVVPLPWRDAALAR